MVHYTISDPFMPPNWKGDHRFYVVIQVLWRSNHLHDMIAKAAPSSWCFAQVMVWHLANWENYMAEREAILISLLITLTYPFTLEQQLTNLLMDLPKFSSSTMHCSFVSDGYTLRTLSKLTCATSSITCNLQAQQNACKRDNYFSIKKIE